MAKYSEVIVRLIGVDPEPEGPAVVGVVVRLPMMPGMDDFGRILDTVMPVATPLIPTWPGRVEILHCDVMLGGVWEATTGPDEIDEHLPPRYYREDGAVQ